VALVLRLQYVGLGFEPQHWVALLRNVRIMYCCENYESKDMVVAGLTAERPWLALWGRQILSFT